MPLKAVHIRYVVYALLLLLVVCDSWAIWNHAEFYEGDRVKEHVMQISIFMIVFHALLCGISFGTMYFYNKLTSDIAVDAISLLKKQGVAGITVILLNAVLFYIFIH